MFVRVCACEGGVEGHPVISELAEPSKQPNEWEMPGLKPKAPSEPSNAEVAVVASDDVTADVAKAQLYSGTEAGA